MSDYRETLETLAVALDEICPYFPGDAERLATAQNATMALAAAIDAAVAAERARIIAGLRERHEADKHRHNYWACLARELEGG